MRGEAREGKGKGRGKKGRVGLPQLGSLDPPV